MTHQGLVCALLAIFAALWSPARAADGLATQSPGKRDADLVTVVHPNDLTVPRVLPPCKPGHCLFAGQRIRMISTKYSISVALLEVKGEFEAATGASLDIVLTPALEHFPTLISDMTNHIGKYDVSLAGAWWLGDLAAGGHLLPYDKFYGDPRFPKWNIDNVLPARAACCRTAARSTWSPTTTMPRSCTTGVIS